MSSFVKHYLFFYFTLLLTFDVTISAYELSTDLYGTESISEPILIDLLESDCMQRLKNIQQYGLSYYLDNKNNYSRYDHSIGVFLLLRRFGASLKEQIAGLLHDASHTVFSHLADTLFKKDDTKDSYQDSIHEWFLSQTDIPDILQKYFIATSEILHKNKEFLMLEQDLPNLCADRIEYNIYGGYIAGLITKNDVANILDALSFEDGIWFFKDVYNAEKLARTSLYLNEHFFACAENWFVNTLGAELLKRALDLDLITFQDIHFSNDLTIWNRIQAKHDATIQWLIKNLFDRQVQIKVTNDASLADVTVYQKFRGINPFVRCNGQFMRLTDLHMPYAQAFHRLRKKLTNGIHIIFTDKSIKHLLIPPSKE